MGGVVSTVLGTAPTVYSGLLLGHEESSKSALMLHMLNREDEETIPTGSLRPRSISQMWPNRAVYWHLPIAPSLHVNLHEVTPLSPIQWAPYMRGTAVIVFCHSATAPPAVQARSIAAFHTHVVPHVVTARLGLVVVVTNASVHDLHGSASASSYTRLQDNPTPSKAGLRKWTRALFPPPKSSIGPKQRHPLAPSGVDPKDRRRIVFVPQLLTDAHVRDMAFGVALAGLLLAPTPATGRPLAAHAKAAGLDLSAAAAAAAAALAVTAQTAAATVARGTAAAAVAEGGSELRFPLAANGVSGRPAVSVAAAAARAAQHRDVVAAVRDILALHEWDTTRRMLHAAAEDATDELRAARATDDRHARQRVCEAILAALGDSSRPRELTYEVG